VIPEHRARGGFEALGRMLVPRRRRAPAGVAAAVLGPVVVTALALVIPHQGTATPALLYLLAVMAAAIIGTVWTGLLSAGLSFVGQDYFFTPPVHTFVVSKAEDLLALAVFLVVAVIVSAAISAALEQRSTAEFREYQVRALYDVSSRLLSGVSLETVLEELALSLRSLYGLAGCRVMVAEADGTFRERAVSGSTEGAPIIEVPLQSGTHLVGRIEMAGSVTAELSSGEVELLKAFAGQLALALERARLGEEAAAAQVEAEASRIRAALFSSVTHDLRTPLASITASASSLLEEGVPFSDEQRLELLRTILEESARLNRLVGNLMDLSRLRAGALVPAVEWVPLEDLVSSVLNRLRSVLAGRPIRVQIREQLPPVPVDVVQMDQVLTNLLENAVRYSPPGTEIGVSGVPWQDMAEVRVWDRGPGVPQAERQRVFEVFHRGDVGGQRGGTGLGLAIAQAIVAAHGGSIWIEETPGGGTTVGFRLPLARRADAAPVPGEALR
jgi:two-component system, OmpR family, sensor histidine kinase KdpD